MGFNNGFSGGNNGGREQEYRPNVYSALPFTNPNGSCGGARLSVSYWKGMMKLHVQPKTGNNNNGFTSYDDKNGNFAFLTPAKAVLLADGIDRLLKGENTAAGVPTTNDTKIVNITTAGKVGGKGNEWALMIGNCDQNGVSDSSVYEFSTDFHSVINDFDMSDNTFTKSTMSSEFELKMFAQMLRDFAAATSNALAASVVDAMYFASGKHTYETLNAIAGKMGLQSGGRASKSNGSFFSNGGGSNSAANNDAPRVSSRPQDIDSADDFLASLEDEDLPF